MSPGPQVKGRQPHWDRDEAAPHLVVALGAASWSMPEVTELATGAGKGRTGPVESPHKGQSGQPTRPRLARDILLGHFPCTVGSLRNLPERSQWFLVAF